eukprot:5451711-Lingulodinium_polyedra.AAC.1
MAFPMTHNFPEFPCIAKYPADAWEEAGAPCMTTKSWANLCIKVAEKDISNLQNVFEVANTLSEKKKESEDTEESDQAAAD